jgi:ubiquinone/menaquinone biosynthesis C-methylase UbiE
LDNGVEVEAEIKLFDRQGEMVQKVVPFLEPSWSVLDVGAGNGILSQRIAEATGVTITLCDIFPQTVPGMTYLPMASPTVLPTKDHSYDVVMMCFMLHHMESQERQEELLSDALRVTRKRLILLEDTAVGRFERMANRGWDYAMNAPTGVPCPFTFRTADQWRDTLERIGFTVPHVTTFRGNWPILRMYTQACIVADVAAND